MKKIIRSLFKTPFILGIVVFLSAISLRANQVAAGGGHSLYVTSDGSFYAMGWNTAGQVGVPPLISPLPSQVASSVIAAAAGDSHSLYVTSDGSLYAMGDNQLGQLGDGTNVNRSTPVKIATASSVVAVAAGGYRSFYVTSAGSLHAMGSDYGSTPVKVASNVIAVAAGDSHVLYVTTDGSLYAMGSNSGGQLGDGTILDRSTPVKVASASNVVAVAAAWGHSLYVTSDGSLYAMGNNEYGQLGDSATAQQRTPVKVASNVIAVATGGKSYPFYAHTLYVTGDGSLYTMGSNNEGQLGDGTTTSRSTPMKVAANVIAVGAGGLHSLYMTNGGSVYAMGSNYGGQLGDGTQTRRYTPVLVTLAFTKQPDNQTANVGQNATFTVTATAASTIVYQWQFSHNGSAWTDIAGATSSTLTLNAVTSDMDNTQYRCVAACSAGNAISSTATLTVNIAPTITTQPVDQTINAGESITFTVAATGKPTPNYEWYFGGIDNDILSKISCYGKNTSTLTINAVPVTMNGMQIQCLVYNSAGNINSQAVTLTVIGAPAVTTQPAGQPVIAGSNASFTVVAIGNPAPVSYQWQSSSDGSTWTDISGETSATLTITAVTTAMSGNQYRCVATNSQGSATSNPATLTVLPPYPVNSIIVAAGASHSLYVTSDGDLYAMGLNTSGQLGDGTTTNRNTPVKVTTASNVIVVAAGNSYSLYVTRDGDLYAMGNNSSGQLGDGSTTNRSTPVKVASNVIAVAAGALHSLYVTRGGDLYAMGYNSSGQLGDSTTTNRSTPVKIATASNVVAVAAGGWHSLYVTSGGSLYAMGENSSGQLGNGDPTGIYRSTPVKITTPSTVTAIAAGDRHSLFSCGGSLYAMGGNGYSQLGDGSTSNRLNPGQVDVDINGSPITGVIAIAAGVSHSLYVTRDGSLYTMGDNSFGQLSNGTPYETRRPGKVASNVVIAAAAGGYHSLFVTRNGWLYTAGRNDCGQLGNGTTTNQRAPQLIFEGNTLASGALLFAAQPVNTTVNATQTAIFTVATTSLSTTTYQWQSTTNGTTWTDVSGATSTTLTITAVTATMSGNQYRCVATNSQGNATSNAATLTVNAASAAPAITMHPANQSATAGQNASFTVAATVNPAPTYQWQSSTDGTTWANVSGQTNTTLTLTAVTTAMSGTQYRCLVTNSYGTTTSNPATLTVNPPHVALSVATQPENRTVSAGQTTSFTITVSGYPTPTYQWQVSSNGTTWSNVSGATDATLTLPNVTLAVSGNRYRCIVTNSLDTVTSAVATLTVKPALEIWIQPENKTVYADHDTIFTVQVVGSPALDFQWQASSNSGATWTNLSDNATYFGSTTAALYVFGVTFPMNGMRYRCIITNALDRADNLTSNSGILTVDPTINNTPIYPVFTTSPNPQTINAGQNAVYTAIASGYPTPTYQWQSAPADSTTWTNINNTSTPNATYSGATAKVLTITAATHALNATKYRCVARNSAGTVNSAAATLTVNPPPAAPIFSMQPAAQTVATGQTATFTIAATGSPTPTYQWQSSTNGTTWANVSGATSASLTLTSVTTAMSGTQYRCLVTNSYGTTTSNPATLTVTSSSELEAAQQLKTQLETSGPATIAVSGTVNLTLVGGATVTSDKTIQGADANATITGGPIITISGSNTIILGLNFTDCLLYIYGATDMEITHCSFIGASIQLGGYGGDWPDNITFSWNKFTSSHVTLSGGSAKITGILLHSNHWDLSNGDLPSIHASRVAMFNNYFDATNCISDPTGDVSDGELLSINNVYKHIGLPIYQTNMGGLIRAFGNNPAETGNDTIFVPAYSYLMLPVGDNSTNVSNLTTRITTYAGNTNGKNSLTPAASITAAAANTVKITTTAPGATATAATIPAGANFTLTANATGFTPTSRQWYLDNFPLAGITGPTHTITNATAFTDAGAYSVALTTPAGEIATSAAYKVTITANTGTNNNGNNGGNNDGNNNGSDGSSGGGGGGGGGGAPSLLWLAAIATLAALRGAKRS